MKSRIVLILAEATLVALILTAMGWEQSVYNTGRLATDLIKSCERSVKEGEQCNITVEKTILKTQDRQ